MRGRVYIKGNKYRAFFRKTKTKFTGTNPTKLLQFFQSTYGEIQPGFLHQVRPLFTLNTRVDSGFILRSYGVFLLNRLNNAGGTLIDRGYKYNFKKNYFSFIYPNQIKKSILMRKKKVVVSRFFKKNKFKKTFIHKYSSKSTLTNFRKIYLSKGLVGSFYGGVLAKAPISFTHTRGNLTYHNDFSEKGFSENSSYGEVLIPRVRFKPGYQRL